MASRIQLRRGTAQQWTESNPILAEGELCVELDTAKCKVGDGVRAWNDLSYAVGATGPAGPAGVNGTNGADGIVGRDGIDGAPGPIGPVGGTVSSSSRLNIVGPLKPTVGTSRWYPMKTVTIVGLSASLGNPSTVDTILAIKKNGITQRTMTINANAYRSQVLTGLTYTLGSNDYLTVDVVNASGGSNLNVAIEFFPHDNIALTSSRMNFIGNLLNMTGSARWYPTRELTLQRAFCTIGTPSVDDVIVDVLLNGNSIFTLSIPANEYKSSVFADVSMVLSPDDFLTANIITAASGRDLSVVVEYT